MDATGKYVPPQRRASKSPDDSPGSRSSSSSSGRKSHAATSASSNSDSPPQNSKWRPARKGPIVWGSNRVYVPAPPLPEEVAETAATAHREAPKIKLLPATQQRPAVVSGESSAGLEVKTAEPSDDETVPDLVLDHLSNPAASANAAAFPRWPDEDEEPEDQPIHALWNLVTSPDAPIYTAEDIAAMTLDESLAAEDALAIVYGDDGLHYRHQARPGVSGKWYVAPCSTTPGAWCGDIPGQFLPPTVPKKLQFFRLGKVKFVPDGQCG